MRNESLQQALQVYTIEKECILKSIIRFWVKREETPYNDNFEVFKTVNITDFLTLKPTIMQYLNMF